MGTALYTHHSRACARRLLLLTILPLYFSSGTSANIARMTVVNAAELVSYDLIKQRILKYKLMSDNLPCHFVSAFGAGFCTTVVASPVDVVKTRFMNSPKDAYKGVFDCAATMFKENGPLAFYKG